MLMRRDELYTIAQPLLYIAAIILRGYSCVNHTPTKRGLYAAPTVGMALKEKIMGLSNDVRKIDDIVVFAASGRFSLGEGTLFQSTVKQYSADGVHKFILNLREVFYIDSSGFGELLKTYTRLQKVQGEVVLLNPSKMVKDLLEITKLSTVFSTFDEESKAIASLK